MQPFPVICETCHARLKVRSDSVIGHILACPKCGSMVEIVPPADWSPAEAVAPSPDPVAEPQSAPTLVVLGRPMFLWAGGGAAVLVAATFVGVLLTRGGDFSQPIDTPAPAVKTIVAGANDAAPRPVPAPTEPSAEPIAAAPTQRPASVDDASIAATVAAITSPPANPPELAEPQSTTTTPSSQEAGADDLTLVRKPKDSPADPRTEHRVEESSAATLHPRSTILDPRAAVRLGPASSASPRSRDIAQQLALPIQSLELSQVPLSQFIETLSDMSAVPITLDPAALRMAGVAANQELSVHSRDTNVAALLTDVLAEHGLAYEEQAGLLTVVKPNIDRQRSVDYEVKDLVGPADADATSLADWIVRFVAPESWKSAGGAGRIEVDGTTLRVEQTDRVHYQVLTFCERLRLARDLPPRSRYPADRLSIEPIYPQLDARLASSTTFTFLPWARLADVIRHWQNASGVTVLVDWNALVEHELGPNTPVACSVVARPWSAAFDSILGPLGLSWWAVDARTIQITGREAAEQVMQIEFYPVAKDVLDTHVSTAAFTATLERELAGRFAAAADPPYHLAFDAASGRLIVLGSPDVQRAVSSRLNNLNHEDTKYAKKNEE